MSLNSSEPKSSRVNLLESPPSRHDYEVACVPFPVMQTGRVCTVLTGAAIGSSCEVDGWVRTEIRRATERIEPRQAFLRQLPLPQTCRDASRSPSVALRHGQAPPEQSSLQVAPSGQSVLQRLLPQLTAQLAPVEHFVLQPPPLQLILHFEPVAQSVSHAPPSHWTRQSAPAAHLTLHFPPVHPSEHLESCPQLRSQRPPAQSLSQFAFESQLCLQPPLAQVA